MQNHKNALQKYGKNPSSWLKWIYRKEIRKELIRRCRQWLPTKQRILLALALASLRWYKGFVLSFEEFDMR